jgi:hypothetical protein
VSSYDDDDNIEFDFFDEPETVEATQRRRLPRLERPGGRGGGERPPRPPLRTPTGLVPLARLVGLIAIAIVIVVALVSWVGACQGTSKHDEYKSYADKVRAIATAENARGGKFESMITSQTLKLSDLESTLQQYAQQEQQDYIQAQKIRPPGPLRALHQNLVDAIELRAKGFQGLGSELARPGAVDVKNQTQTTTNLANQGQLLTASDVVWEQLYRAPATATMVERNVRGVVIPRSQVVPNTDIVSGRAFTILLTRLGGASTGGTPSGKHGDGIVGVRVNPQASDLSTGTPTTVKVSADLSFVVTVEDSGDFQEEAVPVTLTIDVGGTTIKKQQTISLITPTQRQAVTFSGFNLPTAAFGARATVTVFVAPVRGEVNVSNNKATYTVFFTLS